MAFDASILKGSVVDKPSEWTREKERDVRSASLSGTGPAGTSSRHAASASIGVRGGSLVPVSSALGRGDTEEDRTWRAKNKRLATIFEEHGLTYKEPSNAEELAVYERKAARLRHEDILKVMSLLRAARSADLCFVIDATASMDSHTQGVKAMINRLVDELTRPQIAGKQDSSVLNELRLACVAYRDYGDLKQIETLNFTSSVDQFRTFVGALKAENHGNPDFPEDVLGGLNATRKLNWSNASGTKIIFHIGDAPPHGSRFHDLPCDRYPNGHPNDPSLADLLRWLQQKPINYYFGKITNYTDKMIARFEEELGSKITCFDVANPMSLFDAVSASVSLSVDAMSERSKLPPSSVTERTYTIDKHVPEWDKVCQIEGRFQSYLMPTSVEEVLSDKPLVKCKPKKAFVKIAQRPFAEGAERVAFYGLDVTRHGPTPMAPTEVVLKEFKREVCSAQSAKYEMVNEMQTVSSFLAFRFTKEVKVTGLARPFELKFLKLKTFAVQVLDKSYRFLTCERRFSSGEKFVRFSNNAGYTMLEKRALECGIKPEYVDMVMAFSHWTYQVSGGKLMVVDLEGIVTKSKRGDRKVLLTDPAIHCMFVDRYGNLNHGEEGMKKFFETHKCGSFCTALKLRQPAFHLASAFGTLSIR